MVAYIGCWDLFGFEKVSQVSLRLATGKDVIELPIYNNLDQMDVDAYFGQGNK